jgi:predicted RNA binding protein YcfA (HicA-like mRNA interferase family)
MAIKYGRLRSVTAREIIRALGQDGFFFRWQEGSHQRYRHSDAVGLLRRFFHARARPMRTSPHPKVK